MSDHFDPYHKWLGIAPKDQPPHHYRLLGVDAFENDPDVIDAAGNRILSYLKDLGLGDRAADSQRLMNEVMQARICLLDPESKTAYDDRLRTKLRPAAAPPPKRAPAAAAAVPGTPPVAPRAAAAAPAQREAPAISLNATDTRGRHRPRENHRPSWQVLAVIGVLALTVLGVGAFALSHFGSNDPSRNVARDTPPPPEKKDAEEDDDRVPPEDADVGEDLPPDTSQDPDPLDEAESPATTVSDQAGIDLLRSVDPQRHGIEGQWRGTGDGLIVDVEGFARARLMVLHHPPAEYDLHAVIERKIGDGHACLGLVAGGRQFVVALDGRSEEGNHVGGISLVDDKNCGENETTFSRDVLPAGRKVPVLCRVRQDRLTVLCDGVPVIQWQDRWDRLSISQLWAIPDPQALMIGTTRGSFKFHELRLVPSPASTEEPPHHDLATTEEIPPDTDTQPPEDPARTDLESLADDPLDTPGTTESRPAAIVSKHPVPPSEQRQTISDEIAEVYGEQQKEARTAEEKGRLAQELVEAAGREQDTPARYVLLATAHSLATESVSPSAALDVAEKIIAQYDVDAWKVRAETVAELAKHARLVERRGEVYTAAVDLAEKAVEQDEYAAAQEILATAAETALKARAYAQSGEARKRAKAVADLQQQWEAARAALENLQQNPDDNESHQTAGEFLCFVKDDWDKGLPHLARGGDADVQRLAKAEIAKPADAAGRNALGDGWAKLAESTRAPQRRHYLDRAAYWYRQCYGEARGLERLKIARFLEEHDPIWKSAGFGLVAHWKFDQPAGDTAIDSVGGMNGRIHGATWTRGLIAGGLLFKDTGSSHGHQRITFPPADFGAQFTIALWIRPSPPRGSSGVLLSNSHAGKTAGGVSLYLNPGDKKTGWLRLDTGSGGKTEQYKTSQDVIAFGQWHHVVLTVDRTAANARIYVDGRQVPCDGAIDRSFQTTASWLCGANSASAWGYHGLLDDFRIYNRVLTPGEIQNLRKLAAP